jgi:hypothetical protein
MVNVRTGWGFALLRLSEPEPATTALITLRRDTVPMLLLVFAQKAWCSPGWVCGSGCRAAGRVGRSFGGRLIWPRPAALAVYIAWSARRDEDGVAGLMTERVVDWFEPVEVDVQQCGRPDGVGE